jgi:translocation and assembly module TamB
MRARRVAIGAGIAVALLALLVLAGVLVLTRTDWGRDQVRRFALGRIEGAVDGEVEIGRLEGNLLRRIRLVDVAIRDREGRPFLEAETLETGFALLPLLRQRIRLRDVNVVHALVVLDKPPGEDWNYVRIFGIDPEPVEPTPPGWGDWVSLSDVTLVGSQLIVQAEWRPPDDLSPAEREAALETALASDARENVVEVPGGYQNVMDFHDLDARLPHLLVAHPDTAGMSIEVAEFNGLVRPFSAPPAAVEDLAGTFRIVHDSIFMRDVRAVLPGSRLAGGGVYDLAAGELFLRVRGDPVAFPDLRWLYPPLPEEGGGPLTMTLELGSIVNRIILEEMDVRVRNATLAGRLDLTTGDTLRLGDTDLTFSRLDTDLIERFVDADLPRRGEVTGRLAIRGLPDLLAVDGDVRFDDAAGPSSRVVAAGGLGVEPDVRFDDLDLRFAPLQAEHARLLAPDLPLRGTIEGTARLTGSTESIDLEADLALRDPRQGLSRLTMIGGLDLRDELRLNDLLVGMNPLRLDLLRDEIPQLPAGAAATGRVRLDGVPSRALRLDGDIALDDPATGVSGIGATGGIAFGDEVSFDRLQLRLRPLQADLARRWAPELPLEGTIEGDALLTGSVAILEIEADLALRDPRHGLSRIRAAGGVDTRDELRLRQMTIGMDPLRLDLLRETVPELPPGASASGVVRLDGFPSRAVHVDGDVALDDPASGLSGIGATGGVVFDDEIRFDDFFVRADPLQVDLVRGWLPDLPPGGTITGTARLDGVPARFLEVEASLAHHDDALGTSRVQATGGIGLGEPTVFRRFDVRLEPLRMELVRAFAPDLPLAGSLSGVATLDGSPESRIAIRGDLVHEEAGERSHVVGSAEVETGPGGWAAIDARVEPLSLNVAGRFIPEAGLRGSVEGRIQASGALADVRLDVDLRAADGGEIRALGTLDLAAPQTGYDIETRLRDFDLAAVTWRAPAETDLTGAITARGRGLEPETMSATIAADLNESGVDDLRADQVRIRLALAGGLATVDSSLIRLGGAEAVLDGSFGLVEGRTGVLAFEVAIDSLHGFAAWLPGADTAVVIAPEAQADPGDPIPPSPVDIVPPAPVVAVLNDRPRHFVAPDGAQVTVNTTRVRRGIEREDRDVGARPPGTDRMGTPIAGARPVPPDTMPPTSPAPPLVPADSLAGSLHAAGTLRGNVDRFDLDGGALVENLVYQGTWVGAGEASFSIADFGTSTPAIALDAEVTDVRTADLTFDRVSVRGDFRGSRGEGAGAAVLHAVADDDTEYRADLDFTLSLERDELRFADLSLRFDTVTWRTTRPGIVSWAGDAITLADVDIVSDAGGRITLDGRLPVDGSGDLEVVIEELEIEQIVAMLQREEEAEGRLNLDARVRGTLADPTLTGTFRLDDARFDDEVVPDTRATFTYAARELTANAELSHEGRLLVLAEASLPVDLALQPDIVPRLLPGELAIDLRADSLPVEAVPFFADIVDDVHGHARGDLEIRGTFENPVVTGAIDLDLGSLRVVPLEVRFVDVAGTLTFEGGVARVDSLIAYSRGPIRMTGEIGLATFAEPTFALDIEARDALVMDTDDATLVIDADIAIGGSLEAIEVTGDVRTRRGVIYIPRLADLGATSVVSLTAPATFHRLETAFLEERRALERERPLVDRLITEIGVQIDRDVWLRSTEANVEIYTPPEVGPLQIRLNGPQGALGLEGTINTDRGEYEFMSRRFDLTRGSVSFAGEPDLDPILQIAAEHEVRLPGREAFDIRVLLGGTLREIEIVLESTAQPPIAQTDLLSYLAFGRDASSLLDRQGSGLSGQGGDAGELVGNVAGLATQQLTTIALEVLVSDLEADMMRELGVDVFRITPADLPPDMFTGRYTDLLRGTEIEAGRYVSPNLFVAGQVTTGLTRPGVRFEYATPFGVEWLASWKPQWMPQEPTLTERDPRRANVLGSFLSREWRF